MIKPCYVAALVIAKWLLLPSSSTGEDAIVAEKQRVDAALLEARVVYTRLGQEFARCGLEAAFSGLVVGADRDGAPVLRFHTRPWLVYPPLGNGFGPDPVEIEGPERDGVLVTFSFASGGELGSQAIHSGIASPEDAAAKADVRREPYWQAYICGVGLPDRKIRLLVHIRFGEWRTRKLIDAIYVAISRGLSAERIAGLVP